MARFSLKTIGAAVIITILPAFAVADRVSDFEQAWGAAIAPAAQQGGVVLRDDATIEDCNLSYAFTSNGGTVTDAIVLPLTEIDEVQTRAVSASPTDAGVVFILNNGAMGEAIKTLANGTIRRGPTPYGSLFGESFVSEDAALLMLEALFAVASECRGTS